MNSLPARIDRRHFLGALGLFGSALGFPLGLAGQTPVQSQGPASAGRRSEGAWFKSAYRRAVIDMHIPDWDEKFLSQFDADQYVRMLIKSRAQSIVCYAHSHVGLFNYPTRVGQQHRGLKGRNILQEMIDRCHQHGIAVVLYTSLIHDRWAFDQHPEWHMHRHDGTHFGQGSRYGVVCPNSPYREYVRAWVEEMCEQFEFEGIRFDMTFWVGVCYCPHCQRRFSEEAGGEMPKTVNWLDERWVALQRKREAWLAEFAAIATETVRKRKPQATVEHQASTFPLPWTFGVASPLVPQNDFLQGDFYGDALQGSFVRKLLENLTPNRPFGFETSFSVELRDHTSAKSEPLLEAKAAAAISDHAAFVFIDAIDPAGTLNPLVHERMGRVFGKLMPYYEHLGGRRVQDVAVFYSLESKCNFKGNGKPIAQADTTDAHTASSTQAVRWLIGQHRLFGIITKSSLAQLRDCKVLILSNVNMMDDEEVAAIRDWVRNGGALYASGGTSLVDKQGRQRPDFMLSEVFGVSIRKADWQDREHYIAPNAAGQPYFDNFTSRYPAFAKGYRMEVSAHQDAQVLATATLPWPAPDSTKFSSIHSNPPWEATDQPEIVAHSFGRGRVIYASSLIETIEPLGATFLKLLGHLNSSYALTAEAPAAVELTLFHQPDRSRYVLSVVNFQKDLPNIPVDGIKIQLNLPGRIRAIRELPDGRAIRFRTRGSAVAFQIPRLETLALFAVHVG